MNISRSLLRVLPRALVFVLVGALLGSGCAREREVALGVNGHEITVGEFERELKALYKNPELHDQFAGAGTETVWSELTATWLTELANQVLIDDEFSRRKLKVSDADRDEAKGLLSAQYGDDVLAAFPEWMRNRITERAGRFIAVSNAVTGYPLTKVEAQDYFKAHVSDFSEVVCVSHILVNTEAAASEVRGLLGFGSEFGPLARERSLDEGSAPDEGALGCVLLDQFVPEFAAAASVAVVGEVTGPVETEFGWHILVVTERRAPEFSDAEAAVKVVMDTQARNALSEFRVGLARRAKIEVSVRYGSVVVDESGLNIAPIPAPTPRERPSPPTTATMDLATLLG